MYSSKQVFLGQSTLVSSRPFSLNESVRGKEWVFVYMDKMGRVNKHVIKRVNLGSLRIYKNGSTVFASHLEKLIQYLSKGVVRAASDQREVA